MYFVNVIMDKGSVFVLEIFVGVLKEVGYYDVVGDMFFGKGMV